MNLSLNLTVTATGAAANPALAGAAQAPLPPEMASFQDLLAVVGLSPMAVMADGEDMAGEADEAVPMDPAAMAAGETGNMLPPALPVLPDLPLATPAPVPASPVSTSAQSTSAQSATAMPQTSLLDPDTVAQSAPQPLNRPPPADPSAVKLPEGWQANAALTPAPQAAAPTIPASAEMSTLPKGQHQVEIELVPPQAPGPQTIAQAAVQATAQQIGPQPVLAQLLQAAPRPQGRKAGDEVASLTAPVATLRASASENQPTATTIAAPVLPVLAPVQVAATAADLMPAPPPASAAPTVDAAPTAERHDFTAVVDRLVEARELARPGRADMHLAHREFGQVSVQFELAGQALKVAMSSPDAAFAPAVQAALAERPVTQVADAARADGQPQRTDTVNPSTASWQAGTHTDGQRGDTQQRAQQARTGTGPASRHNEGEDTGSSSQFARDGSRFA